MMKRNAEQWACERLQTALHNPDGLNIDIDPIDAVGVHAVLVCLHNAVGSDDGLPLRSIRVDPRDDLLNILLEDEQRSAGHPNGIDAINRRFMANVAELTHAPSGWVLNTFVVPVASAVVDDAVRIQTCKLPNWRTLEHDK